MVFSFKAILGVFVSKTLPIQNIVVSSEEKIGYIDSYPITPPLLAGPDFEIKPEHSLQIKTYTVNAMLTFQIHGFHNISFLGGAFDNQIFSLLSKPISTNSNARGGGDVEVSRQAQIHKKIKPYLM